MTFHDKINAGSVSSRMDAIARKHRKIDEQIAQEHRRPMPDSSLLQKLKREKLVLKDEIARHDGLLRTLSRPETSPYRPPAAQ